MAPDALRMRILTSLSSLLLSQEDRAVQITTPGALLNLTQGLFSLLSSLAFLSAKSADVKLVKELIAKVQAAECGDLIPQALEREYKFGPSEDDEMLSVTHALVLTGIGKFLEHGAESSRRWVLRYSIEVGMRAATPINTCNCNLTLLCCRITGTSPKYPSPRCSLQSIRAKSASSAAAFLIC